MAPLPDPSRKAVYVDFDLLENVKLRISLKLLLAIAGTIVAVTTTTVIGYNNIKKDLGEIDGQVKGLRDDFGAMSRESQKAVRRLDQTDLEMQRQIEELKTSVERLEKQHQ